jgi:phosphatidylserine decarboxylase
MTPMKHQYIDRLTGDVRTEKLFGDRFINLMYSVARESAPLLFRALVSNRTTQLLAGARYDTSLRLRVAHRRNLARSLGIDFSECVDPPDTLSSARRIFERRIRYWAVRPMSGDSSDIVAPADSRVLVGSLRSSDLLFIKGKFFQYRELLGEDKAAWIHSFHEADAAIFRLTPDKYHYSHTPVAGIVRDFYEVDGVFHSCNPGAVVIAATPYSKNKRVVTIIDTDVHGGTRCGLVAMIEVVALMIGDVLQCYSRERYCEPRPVEPGLFLEKGCPKSLFRPGSSVDVLLFQAGRVAFSEDLLANQRRSGVSSRFTKGFSIPLVETDMRVRSTLARAIAPKGEATP